VDPADPEARNEGFEGGAGLFEELPGACRVAIAVGKTNEGESLPANLILPIVLAQVWKLPVGRRIRKCLFIRTPFLCILCHYR
jgi:hypothetical protein